MKCIACKEEMALITMGEIAGLMARLVPYCDNEKCTRYGLLSIKGIKEEKKKKP